MKNITIWPKNTISENLLDKLYKHYNNQSPYDNHFSGKDKRGKVPKIDEVPELYELLNNLNYKLKPETVTGNYLETNSAYPIHADTGKNNGFSLDYVIFLIPIFIPNNCHSYLFLLNQTWSGEAATLVKDPWPTGWNNFITNYENSNLHGLENDKWDYRLNDLGIPFSDKTLNGMSVSCVYKWELTSLISFPCSQLHLSTTSGDQNKIGLSLRVKIS